MTVRLSNRFYALARGWLVLVLFALVTTYMALTLPVLQAAPGGDIVSLDAGFFYTPAEAFAKVASYGAARGFCISVYLTWDVLNSMLYSLALGLLISWLFQRALPPGSPPRMLNLLPLGGRACAICSRISALCCFWEPIPHNPPPLPGSRPPSPWAR